MLACFTRTELLESELVTLAVIKLLASEGAKDLESEVRGDIVRLVLANRVCKLLQPVKRS